jgi:hypothetical protein
VACTSGVPYTTERSSNRRTRTRTRTNQPTNQIQLGYWSLYLPLIRRSSGHERVLINFPDINKLDIDKLRFFFVCTQTKSTIRI